MRRAAVVDVGSGEWLNPVGGSGGGSVAFVFSGQGSQTAAMGRGLYRGRFRGHFDAACKAMGRHLGADPGPLVLGADDTTVQRPLVTQCGLFAVEYALARTLVDLGVRPVAVAGHSIGEYAAAAISGLLTLDEAALLVAVRARATEELADAPGGMLSVLGDEDRLAGWLAGREGLWVAARNAPGRTVVSGTPEALRAAAVELPPLGFGCRPVPVSHPFHSPLMAPVAARLDAAAADLPVRTPDVPTASNLTGTWVDARHQPQTYWGEHVTSAVRWSDDVAALLKWAPDVILEVGPGGVLTSLTAKCLDPGADSVPRTLACMPYAADPDQDDELALLSVLGELWCHGVDLDFAALHEDDPVGDPALRLLLPTYSFERSRYWTKPDASPYAGRAERQVPQTGGPLVRHLPKPGASTRMYCFPYAGGDAAAFRSWAHAAPPWLDVVAVEPPGRGGQSEPNVPADDGADTAWLDQLGEAVRADAGQAAVVFCGLSFGAALALDLLGGPLADWAAGGRVAAFCAVGRAPLGRGAGEEEQDAEAYLMAPDEVRADPQWQRTVLPLLHADLAWDARTEARVAARPPVGVPLQVHCGADDPSFAPDAAHLWAAATSSPVVDVEVHPGAHDFMLHARDAVLARVTAFVSRLTPPSPAPAGTWDGRLHEVTWVPLPAAPGGGHRGAVGRYKGGDPRSALAFLRRELTAADREAVVVCPPPHGIGAEAYCAGWLDLLKGLADAEARGSLTLVLPAQESSGLVAGLTRTFVLEEAGVAVRRVHLDPWPAGGVDVEAVLGRPDAHPGEQDLLLRGGHLLARRLAPAVLPDLPPGTLGQAGGGYLLTGGTGGVGRAVTDWLVHHQGVPPGQVTVTGRTAPAGLRAGVRFLPLDLAEPFDAGAVAAETGPLAGVFHLAGALDDGVLRNLDAARLPAVLAPKLALPRVMDLAARAGAAWVTAFSSTSSLLGAAGQANYAAANGWTDAHARRSPDGGPQLAVVGWGTWEGTGMAAGNARAGDAARSGGETPLPAGTALALLGKVVSGLLAGAPPRQLAACDIDWPASPWAGTPLVAALPAGRAGSAAAPVSAEADAPAQGGQPDALRSFLGAYVHRWDESRRLAELGLDSLDFARMRGDFARTFGKDVPLSAIARPDQRLGQLYAFLSEC